MLRSNAATYQQQRRVRSLRVQKVIVLVVTVVVVADGCHRSV
jgi:hypothetical protein